MAEFKQESIEFAVVLLATKSQDYENELAEVSRMLDDGRITGSEYHQKSALFHTRLAYVSKAINLLRDA